MTPCFSETPTESDGGVAWAVSEVGETEDSYPSIRNCDHRVRPASQWGFLLYGSSEIPATHGLEETHGDAGLRSWSTWMGLGLVF